VHVDGAAGYLALPTSFSTSIIISFGDARGQNLRATLGYFFLLSLRRKSGQNSLTTMVMVSYPTWVPHTLAVLGRVRSPSDGSYR